MNLVDVTYSTSRGGGTRFFVNGKFVHYAERDASYGSVINVIREWLVSERYELTNSEATQAVNQRKECPKKEIVIQQAEQGFYVEYDGKYHDQLCPEEMLITVIGLTGIGNGPPFQLLSPEEWEAQRSKYTYKQPRAPFLLAAAPTDWCVVEAINGSLRLHADNLNKTDALAMRDKLNEKVFLDALNARHETDRKGYAARNMADWNWA